jgi:uncharacterized protein with PQ loop repeat
MDYGYLMNTASALYILCYIPELYANYRNKNANIYNLPEKVVIFVGTSFAFSYSVLNRDTSLIINYAPILVLDTIAMLMRIYYIYKNRMLVEETSPSPEYRADTPDSERSS